MLERLYPGVYVTEIAFHAHAIDGVPTAPSAAPDWTGHNTHDPGLALVGLPAWLPDALSWRLGVASGLHVHAGSAGASPPAITAGHALRPDGDPLDP